MKDRGKAEWSANGGEFRCVRELGAMLIVGQLKSLEVIYKDMKIILCMRGYLRCICVLIVRRKLSYENREKEQI